MNPENEESATWGPAGGVAESLAPGRRSGRAAIGSLIGLGTIAFVLVLVVVGTLEIARHRRAAEARASMQAKVNLLKADIGRSVEAALAVAEAEEWEKTQRALRADDGSGWPMPAEKPAPRKRPDAARVEPRLSALEFQFMELEQEERRRAQEERLRALRGER